MRARAKTGDVLYCDPTYTVAHDLNCFVRYNEKNFSWFDQEWLASAATKATTRGTLVIVSNAHHRTVRTLYEGVASFRTFERKSLVSTGSDNRRTVREYLMVLKS